MRNNFVANGNLQGGKNKKYPKPYWTWDIKFIIT